MLKIDSVSKSTLLDPDKVNSGIWIHLDSGDAKSEKLYLNGDEALPQRALIRSVRCQAIKAAEAKMQKDMYAKLRVTKKGEQGAVIAEGTNLGPAKTFAYTLVALENLSGPGIQAADFDSALALYDLPEAQIIVQQCREAAADDSLYVQSSTSEGAASPPA